MAARYQLLSTGWLTRSLSGFIAGLLCGFLSVILSIGNGSLLFAGNLQVYLPLGIGLSLFAMVVLTAVTAFTSSISGAVAVVQEVPAVTLGIVVAAIASAVPEQATEAVRHATVIAAIGVGTALTGIATFVVGLFRVGSVIRFVPYPVIGGFLAGTGWLILLGAGGLLLGAPVTLAALTRLFEPMAAARFAAAIAFVALIVAAERRTNPRCGARPAGSHRGR